MWFQRHAFSNLLNFWFVKALCSYIDCSYKKWHTSMNEEYESIKIKKHNTCFFRQTLFSLFQIISISNISLYLELNVDALENT